MRHFYFLFATLLLVACGGESSVEKPESKIEFVNEMYAAHGNLGNYEFVFRENAYSFKYDDSDFVYTRRVKNDSVDRLDVLNNSGFYRIENGDTLELSKEDSDKYAESLNSVVYFVCLPLKLNDSAVNMEAKGSTTIKGQEYDVLKVTFDEEGGGKDHEDVFYYWVNQSNHQMDYMAYQYAVNGGGVRFRAAYNSRVVEGMRFQDYVNYGAPVGTDLGRLPELYETGKLEELSLIVTEAVKPVVN